MKDENFFINEDWLWQYPLTGGYAIPVCKTDEIKELIAKLNHLVSQHNIEVEIL